MNETNKYEIIELTKNSEGCYNLSISDTFDVKNMCRLTIGV